MMPSIALVVDLTRRPADLPCASCLFNLAEAAGMSGSAPCPLKGALRRRSARGEALGPVSCDAFTPGFCESEPEPAAGIAAAHGCARLC